MDNCKIVCQVQKSHKGDDWREDNLSKISGNGDKISNVAGS